LLEPHRLGRPKAFRTDTITARPREEYGGILVFQPPNSVISTICWAEKARASASCNIPSPESRFGRYVGACQLALKEPLIVRPPYFQSQDIAGLDNRLEIGFAVYL
jgi:hypothetical protein